jgi:hypothetical protein
MLYIWMHILLIDLFIMRSIQKFRQNDQIASPAQCLSAHDATTTRGQILEFRKFIQIDGHRVSCKLSFDDLS